MHAEASNDNTGNGNGRVTLALLAQEVRNLSDQLERNTRQITDTQRELIESVRQLEIWQSRVDAQVIHCQADVKEAKDLAASANSKANWWNSANSLGAFFSLIVSLFRQQ